MTTTTTTTTTTARKGHKLASWVLRSEFAGISRHANLLYLVGLSIGFFSCMVIMELALEAASSAHSFESLTSTVTLFQFGFCILVPVIVEGPSRIFQNFPKTIAEVLPYLKLSLAVFGATALATHSLHYVSYPTKVVFKSAKLIPTMLVASVMNPSKTYATTDYLSAVLLCAGAAGYSWGSGAPHNDDNANNNNSTSIMGIMLLSTSILCDAFVPNFQQSLMASSSHTTSSGVQSSSLLPTTTTTPTRENNHQHDTNTNNTHKEVLPASPRQDVSRGLTAAELMVNVNSIGFLSLLLYMTFSGSLVSAVSALGSSSHPKLLLYLVTIGTGLGVAVFCYTKLIQGAGSVVAVAVATLRKVVTVILSYLIFPSRCMPFMSYPDCPSWRVYC